MRASTRPPATRRRAALRASLLLCLAAAAPNTPDPGNTLVIDTTKGRIVIAMRPDFAPQSVARVKQLAREHVYDGLLFHRVVDGFVDQTGNPNNHDGGVSNHPNLPPEFAFPLNASQITAIATTNADGITGFIGAQPFAAAPVPGHPGTYRAWGAYCDGVAGMGRQSDITTSNSEIFFMRAPARRIDHDYSVWGRVVSGLAAIHTMNVGFPPPQPDRMLRVRVLADIPLAERPPVVLPRADQVRSSIEAARRVHGADFTVCDVPGL
jgi:peptidylprolyl isomerase